MMCEMNGEVEVRRLPVQNRDITIQFTPYTLACQLVPIRFSDLGALRTRLLTGNTRSGSPGATKNETHKQHEARQPAGLAICAFTSFLLPLRALKTTCATLCRHNSIQACPAVQRLAPEHTTR